MSFWTSSEDREILSLLKLQGAAIARIEAYLPAMEKRMITDIDQLSAAVADNIAAQSESFAAQAKEDANIEAAITKLSQTAGPNPAIQTQITAIQNATAARRAATVAASAENTKLATAIGIAPPPPLPAP